jgi:hypothetical protein
MNSISEADLLAIPIERIEAQIVGIGDEIAAISSVPSDGRRLADLERINYRFKPLLAWRREKEADAKKAARP